MTVPTGDISLSECRKVVLLNMMRYSKDSQGVNVMNFFGKLTLAVSVIILCFSIAVFAIIGAETRNERMNETAMLFMRALSNMNHLNYKQKDILTKRESLETLIKELRTAMEECEADIDAISASTAVLSGETVGEIEKLTAFWSGLQSMLNRGLDDLESLSGHNLVNLVPETGLDGLIKRSGDNSTAVKGNDMRFYLELADFRENLSLIESASQAYREKLMLLENSVTREAGRNRARNRIVSSAALGFALLFAIVFVLLFSKHMAGRVEDIETVMSHVADRNLTGRAKVRGRDELGALGSHVNHVLEFLRGFLDEVKDASAHNRSLGESLSAASSESAAAVNEISRHIESIRKRFQDLYGEIASSSGSIGEIGNQIGILMENVAVQADSVVETETAINQMSVSIGAVAALSRSKRESAAEMLRTVESGGEKVMETNRIVETISNEVDKILEIIGIINGISSQSSLLSMNAAIESAHAGDAGKGFAVVANEIRKLSEDSAEQARIIKNSILTITAMIEEALLSSGRGAEAFADINREVSLFAGDMETISSSMDELASAGNQVLGSAAEVSGKTAEIKKRSIVMGENSRKIEQSMKSIEAVSSEMVVVIGEIDLGTREILNAVNELAEISHESRSRMDNLNSAVKTFVTC